jgi:UDP-N-acetylmuramate--alanine ligase
LSNSTIWQPGQHIHFIGIGGTGLSAIARVLLQRGYTVSGSDKASNATTQALQNEGATVYAGHAADHVQGADAVIATSAVPDSHIEIKAAQQQQIPVFRRSDAIAEIMRGSLNIAIAGTHGKTTTTSMTVHLLQSTGLDPTYIVGGVMANTGTNAAVGSGDAFVIEADEYGHMFHGLQPHLAVLTSVEYDHPDFFTSREALNTSFEQFVNLLPDDGLLIACADDPRARSLAQQRRMKNQPAITYGLASHPDADADWQATNLVYADDLLSYDIRHNSDIITRVTLQVPGEHNVLNSLAALIVAVQQGADIQQAAEALRHFRGTGRRFDVRFDEGQIAVIDDYAHHPTAIRTTIQAARQRYPDRALWAVWQPHTYSRTRHLWDAFLHAFDDAQHVVITGIYASREAHDPSVSILDFIRQMTHPSVHHTPALDDAVDLLRAQVEAPAVILVMSAGDAPHISRTYSDWLTHQA